MTPYFGLSRGRGTDTDVNCPNNCRGFEIHKGHPTYSGSSRVEERVARGSLDGLDVDPRWCYIVTSIVHRYRGSGILYMLGVHENMFVQFCTERDGGEKVICIYHRN